MSQIDVLLVADAQSVHTRRLTEGLVARGLNVAVAGFGGGLPPGVPLVRLGRLSAQHDVRYLLAIPRLARILRSVRPRIIHAHYVSSYGLLAAMARRVSQLDIPLVQTAWGTDLLVTASGSRFRRWLSALALLDARAVTGDSRDLLEIAAQLSPGAPLHRFVFGPSTSLLRAARSSDQIIVSTRRLEADMRVHLIVRAFRRAQREHAPLWGWRLIVAGSGSDESAQAAAGTDPNIEFVGYLDRSALEPLLLRAQVIVSVPVSDATSASLLEGLAAGCRPVLNDLPANREWVPEGVGIFVERDPSEYSLAEAIVQAASSALDPSLSRALVEGVTFEEEVGRLISLYELVSSE